MVANSNLNEEHTNEQWVKRRDSEVDIVVDVVVDLQVDFLSKFYHLH